MPSQEVTLRDIVESGVAEFKDPIVQEQVALAVPEGVSPRKLLRIAATAVLQNPDLEKPALRVSLIQATLQIAASGLMPDGREAAFVIFGNKVVAMPMVLGLRKIAAEYGWSIFTACVYENDAFDPDLEAQKPNHRPVRLGSPRGEMIGAYAAFQHKDGRRQLEVMDVAEIEKIRKVSRAKDSGPWKDWYEEMAQIRPLRRGFKKLPLDPKDRERIDRVLSATAEDGVTLLYGEDESPANRSGDEAQETAPQPPPPEPGQQAAATSSIDAAAPGPDIIDGEAEEVPFEEPPPAADEPRFPTNEYAGKTLRYAGKTLQETFDAGDDGIVFLRWAFGSWKSEPLRSALDAFAEAHPEIKT